MKKAEDKMYEKKGIGVGSVGRPVPRHRLIISGGDPKRQPIVK
jgi:hypothetical protein